MDDDDAAEVIEVGDIVMLTTGDGPAMAVVDARTDEDGFGMCDVMYGTDYGFEMVRNVPADCLDVLELDDDEDEDYEYQCPTCGAALDAA